jgi:hypothetical protein
MNGPGARDGQEKHYADGGRLDQRAECLIIVDVGTLHEPAKNPTGLVPLECPISIELVLEYPLAGDNIDAAGVRNQVPSAVVIRTWVA